MASSSRLREAAEKLVEAAYLDVKVQGESKETVAAIASLKESVDSKLNTLNQNIVNLNANMDAKINTLNQNVVNLNAKMEYDAKQDNLRWAIENSSANEFEYYDADIGYYKKKSGEFVRGILFWFRKGNGWFLPAKVSINQEYRYEQNKEKAVADFHDKLVAQIHGLTGQKPRISVEANGKHAIHYS
jgi:hypothetical protein